MVYRILRFIFRITNKFYFKTIQIKGIENIPKEGPVFFVANHPSAFMDPIVIGTLVNRPLFFLAKGSLFQNKFTKWLLPKFNMIPVFRAEDAPDQMHKNKEVFSHCYSHFAKGGAILVFPEGVSLTERKIKKLKTGAARICLGAEAENNFSLDIKIVTIGLNFSDPHKFQSQLFVNIDEPISVSDYYESYKRDSFKAAHELTDEIRRRLEKQVIAIQDEETDKLVSGIEEIYKAQLLKDLGHNSGNMEKDFDATKAIAESVNYFREADPLRVEKIKHEIEMYRNDLNDVSISDQTIRTFGKSSLFLDAIKSFLFLLIGLPVFLFGFVNNYLPFRIPLWSARFISKRPEFFGSLAISLGTLTFILFYTLQIILINNFLEDTRIVLLYSLLMPLSGIGSFYYYQYFKSIFKKWKIFTLFYKKTKFVTSLILRRESIIEAFEKGKNDFEQRMNGDHQAKTELESSLAVGEVNDFFNLNT